MTSDKILIIGAAGQIGSELTMRLRSKSSKNLVVAADIKEPSQEILESGPFEKINVLDNDSIAEVIKKYQISQIYHLAAVLSKNAEMNPLSSWNINMQGLLNVLELSRHFGIQKIFWPSSIAVFGPSTPRVRTPQETIMDPNTVYGISKLAGERWLQYYRDHYNLDIRSIRYPGLISYKTEPGGGTTDYAVEIFYHAIKFGEYQCFLKPDTALPMMFMDDAIENTIKLMEAPSEFIQCSSYNLGGLSFTPERLAKEIQKHLPHFQISYKPDLRQAIADSWPKSINYTPAKLHWNASCKFTLPRMVKTMLSNLSQKLSKQE